MKIEFELGWLAWKIKKLRKIGLNRARFNDVFSKSQMTIPILGFVMWNIQWIQINFTFTKKKINKGRMQINNVSPNSCRIKVFLLPLNHSQLPRSLWLKFKKKNREKNCHNFLLVRLNFSRKSKIHDFYECHIY